MTKNCIWKHTKDELAKILYVGDINEGKAYENEVLIVAEGMIEGEPCEVNTIKVGTPSEVLEDYDAYRIYRWAYLQHVIAMSDTSEHNKDIYDADIDAIKQRLKKTTQELEQTKIALCEAQNELERLLLKK